MDFLVAFAFAMNWLPKSQLQGLVSTHSRVQTDPQSSTHFNVFTAKGMHPVPESVVLFLSEKKPGK